MWRLRASRDHERAAGAGRAMASLRWGDSRRIIASCARFAQMIAPDARVVARPASIRPARISKRQREILAEYAAESGESVAPGHGGILDKVRDALG